jgi:hypothetical protein
MRDDVFAVHSLDTHPKRDAAEHEFRWEAEPREFEPNPETEKNRSISKARPDLRRSGNMLHLVLAGLVAIAIVGVFFGASFHLLAPSVTGKRNASKAEVGTSPLALGDALRANVAAQPVLQELAVPKSSGPAAPSASPAAPRAAAADAPARELREPSAAPIVVPIKDPPAQTAAEPAATSNPAPSPAQSAPSAGLPLLPSQDAATSSGTKHHPSRSKNHEARSVSRHSHGQSAHAAASVTTHRARQPRSFDRLVTQLTDRSAPGGATLTPPRTQEPDPFALRRATQ